MSISKACRRLRDLLSRLQVRVVFAESCTGGLVAASLSRLPGISNYLCGSAVTYRDDTKRRWLDVPPDLLQSPGAVSEAVARQMACGALHRTPEATWSAAITGHLGPEAPAELDGLVYIAVAERRNGAKIPDSPIKLTSIKQRLASKTRIARQREAAVLLLTAIGDALQLREKEETIGLDR